MAAGREEDEGPLAVEGRGTKAESGGLGQEQGKREDSVDADPVQRGFDTLFCLLPRGEGSGSYWLSLVATASLAIAVRQAVAAHPYSGMGKPPMYGDYEAQRHWMEVTVNLPLQDWYRNTKDNDLMYWGLDYPPLTAYISWAFGKIATRVNPKLVELHSSRGYETPSGKMFMRATVLFCDVLLFFPAVYAFTECFYGAKRRGVRAVAWTFMILNPAFILIDHGHFQYNCVAHAFVLLSVSMLLFSKFSFREPLGACAFCLALLFKQMSLYYSLAFFFFLLGRSLQVENGIQRKLLRIFMLGTSVIATFAVHLIPFYVSGGSESLFDVFRRVFPVGRGIFEDKVANFWCASHLFIKWKSFPRVVMLRVCIVCTLAALLPTVIHTCLRPSPSRFVVALAGSSLSFFLFSFQVHEKSILLPLLPLAATYPSHPLLAVTATLIANASMFPLLRRDGLSVPYTLFQFLFGYFGLLLALEKLTFNPNRNVKEKYKRISILGAEPLSVLEDILGPRLASKTGGAMFFLSVLSVASAHVLDFALPKNEKYPDINVYLFVLVGSLHFLLFWALLFLVDTAAVLSCSCSTRKKKTE